MEIKNKVWLVAAVTMSVVTSCGHDLLKPLDAQVRLSADNTYEAGSKVTFDFDGYADYVYFYSGESGSEYSKRDRTEVSLDEVEYADMTVTLSVNNGKTGGLEVYVTDLFEGLSGTDMERDGLLVNGLEEAISQDDMTIPGWMRLDLKEPANKNEPASVTVHDISEYLSNFLVAVRWKPVAESVADMQRYYYFQFIVDVKFKGRDVTRYSGNTSVFGYTLYNVNTIEGHEDDHYFNGERYDGKVRTQVYFNTGAYPDGFRMDGGRNLGELIHAWIISKPQNLAVVAPDKGLTIKSYSDDMASYSHVYDEPGTYTATFVMSNGNIQGTEKVVKEVTFEIR